MLQLNTAFSTRIQLCCVFMQKRVGEVVLSSYLGMLITCLKCFYKVLLDHTMPSVLQLIVVNYTGMNFLGKWMALLKQFVCDQDNGMTQY